MGDLINLVSKLNNVTLISKSYIKIMELFESLPGVNEMLTVKDKENLKNIKNMLNE
jgi:hypothetical protein